MKSILLAGGAGTQFHPFMRADARLIHLQTLIRGFVWLDTCTQEAMSEANEFVKAIENERV